MTKSILITLAVMVAMASCRKEKECTTKGYKEPCNIAFRGGSADEVDTVIQKNYEPGTKFSRLISTDTLIFPDVTVIGNIAYSTGASTYMALVSEAADCELILPTRTYRLATVGYSGDSIVRWTSKYGCVSTASFRLPPLYVSVNDTFTMTETPVANDTRWILLDK